MIKAEILVQFGIKQHASNISHGIELQRENVYYRNYLFHLHQN